MAEVDFSGTDAVLRPVDGVRPCCVLGGSAFACFRNEVFERFELLGIVGLRVCLCSLLRLRRGERHALSEGGSFLPRVLAALRLIVDGIGFLPHLGGHRGGRWIFAPVTFALFAIPLLFLLI